MSAYVNFRKAKGTHTPDLASVLPVPDGRILIHFLGTKRRLYTPEAKPSCKLNYLNSNSAIVSPENILTKCVVL